MFDLLQTYTAVYERKELEKEYSDLVASEKPCNVIPSYWTLGVLGIIGLIFIVLVLGSDFFQTLSTTSLLGSVFYAIGYIILFVIALIILALILFVVGILVKLLNYIFGLFIRRTTAHQLKLNEISHKQKVLQDKYNELNHVLLNSHIPAEFQDMEILEFLNKVIKQRRASTIPEAINLYVAEMQHQEQLNKITALEAQSNRKIKVLEQDLAQAHKAAKKAQKTADSAFFISIFK